MSSQKDITPSMRAILVDWLIEVQENFELFHETLYLAVQLTDHYLSISEVRREYLQLVGATCMLIASKFEVCVYVCVMAYCVCERERGGVCVQCGSVLWACVLQVYMCEGLCMFLCKCDGVLCVCKRERGGVCGDGVYMTVCVTPCRS